MRLAVRAAVLALAAETAIQLHGTGPWVIEYVNTADDPRKSNK